MKQPIKQSPNSVFYPYAEGDRVVHDGQLATVTKLCGTNPQGRVIIEVRYDSLSSNYVPKDTLERVNAVNEPLHTNLRSSINIVFDHLARGNWTVDEARKQVHRYLEEVGAYHGGAL